MIKFSCLKITEGSTCLFLMFYPHSFPFLRTGWHYYVTMYIGVGLLRKQLSIVALYHQTSTSSPRLAVPFKKTETDSPRDRQCVGLLNPQKVQKKAPETNILVSGAVGLICFSCIAFIFTLCLMKFMFLCSHRGY